MTKKKKKKKKKKLSTNTRALRQILMNVNGNEW